MNIFVVSCAVLGYIRPKSALVVYYGLLAKWLGVWVRVRVRVRECSTVLFFLVLWTPWFGSLCKYVIVYLWFHVWLVTSVPQIEWKKWVPINRCQNRGHQGHMPPPPPPIPARICHLPCFLNFDEGSIPAHPSSECVLMHTPSSVPHPPKSQVPFADSGPGNEMS